MTPLVRSHIKYLIPTYNILVNCVFETDGKSGLADGF